MSKQIAIGSDHAGFDVKTLIVSYLKEELNEEIIDCGTFSNESCDYPEFAHAVAEKVESGQAQLGILICGSANGVCMSANKHQGIRAAIAWDVPLAELARGHNDANVICLPARFISESLAKEIISAFLKEEFEGGRHARRVGKIPVS